MNILSLEGVFKSYGVKPLLVDLSFGLDESDKVGLIGINGSGKTTLLRVIAGEEPPDKGRVELVGNLVITLLPQDPAVDESQTVMQAVYAGNSKALAEKLELLEDYETACHREPGSGAEEERRLRRLADLQHRVEASGAWELEKDAKALLAELGLPDPSALLGTLSGGQCKRVALAHALLVRSDLLILDEPTNHLDPEIVEWLEDYLAKYAGALLLVTHDRYFLDRVTNRILELDSGRVRSFAGDYADYLEQKQVQDELETAEARKLQRLAKKELEWLRRGPKARTTKAQHRVDKAEALLQQASDAKSLLTKKRELDLKFQASRLGKKILDVTDLCKSYGECTLIRNFTRSFAHGDRIGIIGPNGAGKTTLLEILAGHLPPDSGEIDRGQTAVVGYYAQKSRILVDQQRVIDCVEEVAQTIKNADGSTLTASQMLDRFLFPPAMQYQPTNLLSGGERQRLALLRVLMASPNLLLLDEVTNDLDIPTLLALEDYLESFPGCVVSVSHDRYFLDQTVDTILRFEGQGVICEYPGNYSAFQAIRDAAQRTERAAQQTVRGTQPRANPVAASSRKTLTYKEKKQLETLETEIATGEARKEELGELLIQHASDYQRAQKLGSELEVLNAELDQKMNRWAELADRG